MREVYFGVRRSPSPLLVRETRPPSHHRRASIKGDDIACWVGSLIGPSAHPPPLLPCSTDSAAYPIRGCPRRSVLTGDELAAFIKTTSELRQWWLAYDASDEYSSSRSTAFSPSQLGSVQRRLPRRTAGEDTPRCRVGNRRERGQAQRNADTGGARQERGSREWALQRGSTREDDGRRHANLGRATQSAQRPLSRARCPRISDLGQAARGAR